MNTIVHIRGIAQAHEMLGLPAPAYPLISLIPIDGKVAEYEYGNRTYVHDFYQVTLKSGIAGDIIYGRNRYGYTQGTMIFSKPGQALRYGDVRKVSGQSGWALLFHPDLIRRSDLGRHIEAYPFFSYDSHEALHISEREKQLLTNLVDQIALEYRDNIDTHTNKLILSHITLILDYCSRFHDRQFSLRGNDHMDMLSELDTLLKGYFEQEKMREQGLPSVKYFAEALNISSSYLSDLLKNATGNNAQRYIQDYLIEKAKYRLLGSDARISQIAYSLGFEYPQHFSKLFKSRTGMTPSEYRKVSFKA